MTYVRTRYVQKVFHKRNAHQNLFITKGYETRKNDVVSINKQPLVLPYNVAQDCTSLKCLQKQLKRPIKLALFTLTQYFHTSRFKLKNRIPFQKHNLIYW